MPGYDVFINAPNPQDYRDMSKGSYSVHGRAKGKSPYVYQHRTNSPTAQLLDYRCHKYNLGVNR